MRMTVFSPIALSHTMLSAKPTPSVAEQAKPLALQPASGDTFTPLSAQKAENRSGLNTNWDTKYIQPVVNLLEKFTSSDCKVVSSSSDGFHHVQLFFNKLNNPLGDCDALLSKAVDGSALYLVRYGENGDPEALIHYTTDDKQQLKQIIQENSARLERHVIKQNITIYLRSQTSFVSDELACNHLAWAQRAFTESGSSHSQSAPKEAMAEIFDKVDSLVAQIFATADTVLQVN